MLTPDYEAEGRVWTQREARQRVLKVDKTAGSMVGHVLRRLRAVHEISSSESARNIQGLARCAKKRGIGVCLHVTSARGVRAQIVAAARKIFHARLTRLHYSVTLLDYTARSHCSITLLDYTA